MNFYYLYYFLASFSATFILMPFGLKMIRKLNFVDRPNDRKVHNFETPTGGGVIIFVGILLSLSVFSFSFGKYLDLSFSYFLGLLIIFIMGLMDDKNDLSPKIKLLAQIISATIFISLSKQFILFDFVDNKFVSVLLTIFFIISVINAYNLIDGLDGLASGLAIITISSLILVLNSDFKIIFYSIIGILFAFLRRNSYPAKIFLGDTGSYMLGYSIAILAVLVFNQPSSNFLLNNSYSILILILCIGLPLIDTTYAFLRRLYNGENIFKADKKHIHHILLSYKISHKNSVSILYIIQSLFSIVFLFLLEFQFNSIYLFVISLFVLKHILTICDIRPNSFSIIFQKIKILNSAYIYFFFSIIILLHLISIQNSQAIFNLNFLYASLLVLFINLLFILDKRTRRNNNIDISIVSSSIIMLYFCFSPADGDYENWIFIIKSYVWYPIGIGLILSLFGMFKEKNDLLESPTEYLILFYIAIIMPIAFSDFVNLFFLKLIIILIIYKIVLQDKVIREFNIIHFINICMLFFLILYNI